MFFTSLPVTDGGPLNTQLKQIEEIYVGKGRHILSSVLQSSQVDTEAKYYMLTPNKKNLISAQRLWCCPGGHFIVLLEKAKGDHLASVPACLHNFNYCFFLHNLL